MTTGNPFVLTRDGIMFPDDPDKIAALKKRMVDHIAETTIKYQQLKEVCDLLDHLEQFELSLKTDPTVQIQHAEAKLAWAEREIKRHAAA